MFAQGNPNTHPPAPHGEEESEIPLFIGLLLLILHQNEAMVGG